MRYAIGANAGVYLVGGVDLGEGRGVLWVGLEGAGPGDSGVRGPGRGLEG